MVRQGRLRWAIGLLAAIGGVAVIVLQVHHAELSLARSGVRVLQHALGPDVVIGGSVEAHALPRPHIVLTDVHVHDPAGGGDLDVPRLEATQSLSSLLAGRISFSQLRLSEPTASIDADRLSDNVRHAARSLLGYALPGRIVVSSAVVAIRSSHPAGRGLLTGFNGVLEGLDRNGSATLTGRGTWHGEHLEVSAHLEPIFDFMLGRSTAGGLKLHTPTFAASVDGHLRAGVHGGFEGNVAFSTPSLAAFLQTNGLPATLGRAVDRVSFTGSGVANPDNITFSNARLVLDDTPLEGSLAWQPDEDHGAWTGTFATDTLDLTHVFALLPQARDAATRWSDAPWRLDRSMLSDIDLRVSSNRARIGPVVIEDAAFSALCRDGRLEASLSEARSLDGLIRGRAVANIEPHGLDLKLDLSLSQMDLEPLFSAMSDERVTGTASGHFVGEAHGLSPKSLIQSFVGHGQLSVREGSLPALTSVVSSTAAGAMGRLWPRAEASSSFDLVTADLDVRGDHVGIAHGRMIGADLPNAFKGEASLLERSFSLTATDATPPAGTMAMGLAGTWDPVLRVTSAPMSAPDAAGQTTSP